MTSSETALLPNGFMDLLPPQAEKEAKAIETLVACFRRFGYQRVKPPLLEFEDSLLAPGPGQALARQTFRLMDPVSQRMMGLRADTTAQISRIASTRLYGQERPLRLCYAADVLRVNGSQLRPERQFVQVGCELIGESAPRADAEIALLSVYALHTLGVRAITIDLSVPSLVDTVFAAFKTSDSEKASLKKALQMRDFDAINPLASDLHQCLARLLSSAGPAPEAISCLLDGELPDEARQSILTLQSVYNEFADALTAYGLEEVSVTVDPVEFKGHDYHKGISFTLFSAGQRGELGSGGRYQSGTETATGFTLYLDTVLRAYEEAQPLPFTAVSAEEPWVKIKELQDQGHSVVRKG